jgi:hypothetical protein
MKKLIVTGVLAVMLLGGCSNLVLKPAEFGWPVEVVLKPDNNGVVQEKRYAFSFNTRDLFLTETGDSLGYKDEELRVIRNPQGYYFMVANNFKNVYVFYPDQGSMSLTNKIEISDSTGITSPSFNQRPPYVELNYDNNKDVYLTSKGIKEEGKQ